MLPGMADQSIPIIDVSKFQEPLWRLAETMAQKVKREGAARMPGPLFIAEDNKIMIRQSNAT